MKKLLGPLIFVGVVALAVFFATSDGASEKDISQFFTGELTDVQATDNKTGAGDKGVTIIEYGDFQCPFCGRVFPIVDEVKEQYGDDITLVYRHYPLISLHPNAMAGHRASEAAALQDKFFEMHDLLFENQTLWSGASSVGNALEIIEEYAEDLDLDMDQYRTDIESVAIADKINAQQASGTQLGVTGTPTFFVNGEQISTPGSVEEFSQIIDSAIAGDDVSDIETTGESSNDAETEDAEGSESTDSN